MASALSPEIKVVTSGAGFATRLREATATIHREAERTGFVADLLHGRAAREGYTLFLRNLVPVYAALETAIPSVGYAELLAPFRHDGLKRQTLLLSDLSALAGAVWANDYPVLPESRAYAAAIEAAKGGDGVRLAGHAYVRYLGDLSGGQILRPLIARTLALPYEALQFYDFSRLGDLAACKSRIRRTLDAVDVESAMADAWIDEAQIAYRHNIALSEAVSRAIESARH
jgi:heme oxygenase